MKCWQCNHNQPLTFIPLHFPIPSSYMSVLPSPSCFIILRQEHFISGLFVFSISNTIKQNFVDFFLTYGSSNYWKLKLNINYRYRSKYMKTKWLYYVFMDHIFIQALFIHFRNYFWIHSLFLLLFRKLNSVL